MKLVADSKGRLTAAELFRPGKAFDVTPQPDGSLRVVELAERTVPTVKIKFNKDGTWTCPPLLNRKQVRDSIRADRDAQ